jgi:hypothetical protein
MGAASRLSGTFFISDNNASELLSVIRTGTGTIIDGEVYAPGMLFYKGNLSINGRIYAKRFLNLRNTSAYENYLIDLRIDNMGLSTYFLSSMLTSPDKAKDRILQWFER